MTTTTTTEAQAAAQQALGWAQRAEHAHEIAVNRRKQADEWAAQRGGHGNAAEWYERADDWDRTRDKAVDMANMWANVAGVLPIAEPGEPS